MANGPGLTFGAGVADAPRSELTADAKTIRADVLMTCQDNCSGHNPIASDAAPSPAESVTLSEASPDRVIAGTSCGVGSRAEVVLSMDKDLASHAIGSDSPGGSDSQEVAATGPAAASSSPPQHTTSSHLSPSVIEALDPCSLLTSAGSSNSNTRGQKGSREIVGGGCGPSVSGGHRQTAVPLASSSCDVRAAGDDNGDGNCRRAGAEAVGPTGEGTSGCGSKVGSGGNMAAPNAATAAAGVAGGLAISGSGGSASQLLAIGISNSMLKHVSREVIRKLRLAASAGSAEDRHVVCEELFADITCALDASAQAALLGPATVANAGAVEGDGDAAAGGAGGSGRRACVRGRLYYEVLAVYYASRNAADSARVLLHLCQLLWDTPWVAPIFALLLHRFLLLPRETATSPTAAATASSDNTTARGSSAGKSLYSMSYSDPRVKHLNVLAHGARQLLLGDVHSGLFRFQPLWAFLVFEVAGLAPNTAPDGSAGGDGGLAALGASLPPVTGIDAVPATARPWLLAVAAAFLPYYCLDEQVSELARRFPPPTPLEGAGVPTQSGLGSTAGGGDSSAGASTAVSLAGLDFLVVEVTDVLGRINSEVGLLKYLSALRALAKPPSASQQSPSAPVGTGAKAESKATPQPVQGTTPSQAHRRQQVLAAQLATGRARSHSDGGNGAVIAAPPTREGDLKATAGARRPRSSQPPPPPLAGLPTITKLRLQSELYSLTSGGGPRYAPPEVRRAAFAALDALFPGGRSLRWFVRWASRTLHLEWLDGDGAPDDPWVGRGWVGWIYWPIHWCTALYGKILLAFFQLIYGMVVWRPGRRSVPEMDSVTGPTNGSSRDGCGGAATRAIGSSVVTKGSAGAEAEATGLGAAGSGGKTGPWWQPRLRGHR
ncbi:hypothetical protein Vafri_7776 [Volvox africanus]|uniref:Uncharacterized protein n=1 Tax=Volvox africanus TaxID=51714 RepID=A0A8J4EYD4_9CHLO|nr:hypothetical protein Vafri_7776 [Volvox africanus]